MANKSQRVTRGGCWFNRPSFAQVSFRKNAVDVRYLDLGVRLIRFMTTFQQLAEVNNDQ